MNALVVEHLEELVRPPQVASRVEKPCEFRRKLVLCHNLIFG